VCRPTVGLAKEDAKSGASIATHWALLPYCKVRPAKNQCCVSEIIFSYPDLTFQEISDPDLDPDRISDPT